MTTENTTDTSSEDTSGLKNKNAELLRKLKEAENGRSNPSQEPNHKANW
jgi:hypothetical protein